MVCVVAVASLAVAIVHERMVEAADEDFRVTIFRQYPDQRCTSGYLAVNGEIIVYTLELPWKDNKKNISFIPAGIYSGFLRYDHSDHWRIELQDVPGNREYAQIHIGNVIKNTEGCILVGMKLEKDLCSIVGGTSVTAYKALKKAFYGTDTPNSTPNKTITVEIVNGGIDMP